MLSDKTEQEPIKAVEKFYFIRDRRHANYFRHYFKEDEQDTDEAKEITGLADKK